jgi:hypothetical protein
VCMLCIALAALKKVAVLAYIIYTSNKSESR